MRVPGVISLRFKQLIYTDLKVQEVQAATALWLSPQTRIFSITFTTLG
jgi:hypothetical protein